VGASRRPGAEGDGRAWLAADAELAARGLSNRDIAQRLFLSHRTIGSHLYRIFPKLGITSRQQLAGVLTGAPEHVLRQAQSFD
jgi:hypothetical protein